MIEAEKGSVALVMHVSSVIGMKNGVPPLRAGQPRCRYAKLTHALEDPYRAYNLYTLIVSILCIATLIRCNAAYQTRRVSTSLADLACPKTNSQGARTLWRHQSWGVIKSWAPSGLAFGGVHGGAADDLPHLAGLFRERAHLRGNILAMQTHHVTEILGVQQRLRIIERSLHVLLGIGHCLRGDVLGARADRGAALLDRAGGRLRAGQELFEPLARLFEARVRHGAHFLRDFGDCETVMPIFVHGPTPFALAGRSPAAPFAHDHMHRNLLANRFRRYDAAFSGLPIVDLCRCFATHQREGGGRVRRQPQD